MCGKYRQQRWKYEDYHYKCRLHIDETRGNVAHACASVRSVGGIYRNGWRNPQKCRRNNPKCRRNTPKCRPNTPKVLGMTATPAEVLALTFTLTLRQLYYIHVFCFV